MLLGRTLVSNKGSIGTNEMDTVTGQAIKNQTALAAFHHFGQQCLNQLTHYQNQHRNSFDGEVMVVDGEATVCCIFDTTQRAEGEETVRLNLDFTMSSTNRLTSYYQLSSPASPWQR